eukprot:s2360_g3.t1
MIGGGYYEVTQSFGSKQVVRLIGDMRMALSILHDHHIIHGDVRLANIMVRLDPPSFVLIDYGGCLESLWPVKQGYMVEGQGGAQHRPPAECTTRPFVCLRSDSTVWATRSAQIETDGIELMRVTDSAMLGPWRRHKTQGAHLLGFQVPPFSKGGGGGGRRLSDSTVAGSAPAARPSTLPEDAPISFHWPVATCAARGMLPPLSFVMVFWLHDNRRQAEGKGALKTRLSS